MPKFHTMPLDEFNSSYPLLSRAFPSLYPCGEADFVEPLRQRKVNFDDYIDHMMKYQDGRFAQHPRFRYVAYNMLMRRQSMAKSKHFVRANNQYQNITVEDLRAALEGDDDDLDGQRLLNAVVR